MVEDEVDRAHKHLEQFQGESPERLTPGDLRLQLPDRKLVVVSSPDDLKMLEACLVETDPDTTEIVILAAHPPAAAGVYGDPEHTEIAIVSGRIPSQPDPLLGLEDRKMMTAVVNRAELVGKPLKPAIILTDDPQTAMLRACACAGGPGADPWTLRHRGVPTPARPPRRPLPADRRGATVSANRPRDRDKPG